MKKKHKTDNPLLLDQKKALLVFKALDALTERYISQELRHNNYIPEFDKILSNFGINKTHLHEALSLRGLSRAHLNAYNR